MPAINVRTLALTIAVSATLGAMIGVCSSAFSTDASRLVVADGPGVCGSAACESMVWLRTPAVRRGGR